MLKWWQRSAEDFSHCSFNSRNRRKKKPAPFRLQRPRRDGHQALDLDSLQRVDCCSSLSLLHAVSPANVTPTKVDPLALARTVLFVFGYQTCRLLSELQQINALKRIEIQGLMTIARRGRWSRKVCGLFFAGYAKLKRNSANKSSALRCHI